MPVAPQWTAKASHRRTAPLEHPSPRPNAEAEYHDANRDKFKKNYNMQLVPIDPGDSSQLLPTFVDEEDDTEPEISELRMNSERQLVTGN